MEHQANGITISLEIEGTGPTVVLVHSLAADRTMWWQQTPALASRYQVIAYDVRGHGRSSRPPGPYSLELFADDLRALLIDLGVAQVHFAGISMGGMIGQAFALRYPDSLASLTLIDTASEYSPALRAASEARAALAESEGLTSLIESTMERWFTAPFHQTHPDVIDRIRTMIAGNDPLAYAAATRAIREVAFTRQLAQIRVPTLVVVGEQDPATTPAMSEQIHRQVGGSELAIIPNAAHLSPVEQPRLFNDLFLDFLARAQAVQG